MKIRNLILILTLSFCLIFQGCSNSKVENATDNKKEKKITAVFYANGTLGDKGYFDSVQRGVLQASEVLGIETKTVEGGSNQADWPSGLESLVASNYDVVIVGSGQMLEITKELAQKYPKQHFIFYDETIKDIPNVYSMLYSQSEGSFLAGAFAALVTTSKDLKGANPEKIIGFLGGMDIPIVNDFKYGYEQGAHFIDPDIQIVSSYVGDFNNAPKAKELALAQYNSQKVDIIYNVAGGSGLGMLEAGNQLGKYSIGVDSNQNPLYPGSVLTSMMKNVDQSIVHALDLYKKGELKYGINEILGLKENGVGLAKDKLYEEYVPKSIQDRMKDIEVKLINGEIKVKSSFNQ